MCAFVDFQGFVDDSNSFIFKELAVLKDEFEYKHFILEPPRCFYSLPYKVQKQFHWLTNNYHGLHYDSGDVPYDKMGEVLKEMTLDVQTVYVKGLQKRLELAKLIPDKEIINLEELGCPNLRSLTHIYLRNICENHHIPNGICSLQNVKNCYLWKNEHVTARAVSEEDNCSDDIEVSCTCFGC